MRLRDLYILAEADSGMITVEQWYNQRHANTLGKMWRDQLENQWYKHQCQKCFDGDGSIEDCPKCSEELWMEFTDCVGKAGHKTLRLPYPQWEQEYQEWLSETGGGFDPWTPRAARN